MRIDYACRAHGEPRNAHRNLVVKPSLSPDKFRDTTLHLGYVRYLPYAFKVISHAVIRQYS
jgi:hypothetical protein